MYNRDILELQPAHGRLWKWKQWLINSSRFFSHLLFLIFTVSTLNFRLTSGWQKVPCGVPAFLKARWLPWRSCNKTQVSRRFLVSTLYLFVCAPTVDGVFYLHHVWLWVVDINRKRHSRTGTPTSPQSLPYSTYSEQTTVPATKEQIGQYLRV